VFHLIETAKFNEAKGVVEEMINDEKSANWYRTWYARGLLCQTAYREGIRRNDSKLTELYPDQLYEAFVSFEKAARLDRSGRLDNKLVPRYIMLLNDFQRLGERGFNARNFEGALRAFEHALDISQRPFIDMPETTNLLYNAALSAYESKNWDKAVRYLNPLHGKKFSVNATHLLFNAFLEQGDAPGAIRVMAEGIENFEENEEMVLLLADLHVQRGDIKNAIKTLDEAIARDPSNFKFHHTQGLIYQKSGDFNKAILAYFEAAEHAPDELMIYVNIAKCYYNIGVEIEANARTITSISAVRVEQGRSAAAFESAVSWLDKVYEKEPADQVVLSELMQLYRTLRVTDKVRSLESRMN